VWLSLVRLGDLGGGFRAYAMEEFQRIGVTVEENQYLDLENLAAGSFATGWPSPFGPSTLEFE